MIIGNIEKIYSHAIKEYPREACGYVLGTNVRGIKKVKRIIQCTNIQDMLHKLDPERYPRNSRTAYNINEEEYREVLNIAQEKRLDIIADYHSHPDQRAYFSEEDIAAETVFGPQTNPDRAHIVTSILNKKILETRSFKWKGKKIFAPEAIINSVMYWGNNYSPEK